MVRLNIKYASVKFTLRDSLSKATYTRAGTDLKLRNVRF